jgi:choline-sulfatase
MRAGERTIAHLAKEAGFATGAIGKMHFIGSDQHQGFDARWDILDYYALERQACGDAASGMAAPGCYGKYVPGEEGSVAGGPNPMFVHHGNYDAQPSPFPAAHHVEACTTREAVRFMEEHRHERWMLWCSYFKPHAPYTPPVEDWERYAALPLTHWACVTRP